MIIAEAVENTQRKNYSLRLQARKSDEKRFICIILSFEHFLFFISPDLPTGNISIYERGGRRIKVKPRQHVQIKLCSAQTKLW